MTCIGNDKLDADASTTPTHFGLGRSQELCWEILATPATNAGRLGQRIEIDMDDSPLVGGTVALAHYVPSYYSNVHAVIQITTAVTRSASV